MSVQLAPEDPAPYEGSVSHDNDLPPLDAQAVREWARYLRMMRLIMIVIVGLVIAAMVLLYRSDGTVSIESYIRAALGLGFMMLAGSGYMGWKFLSNRKSPSREGVD